MLGYMAVGPVVFEILEGLRYPDCLELASFYC